MRLVPNTDIVPAAVNRYLLPHERQVITVHFHPAVLMGPIGAVLAGLAAAIWASNSSTFSSDAVLIIWLTWALLLLYALGKVFRWFFDYFAVTSQRLVLVKGLLTRDVVALPIVKAASMKFRRSTMGRVLGYGQFIVEADRTQPVWKINFMPYPEQLYLEITGLIFRDREESAD
jgi:membrane protein YdbS with pleckstrin-like domain